MKKMQKGFSAVDMILAFGVLVLLVADGWYVWHGRQAKPAHVSTANTTTTTRHASEAVVKIPTAQAGDCHISPTKASAVWKTFTSDKYQFSISYPASCTTPSCKNSKTTKKP